MGLQENVQAATKELNKAIDGVEQFVQKIVDAKIKKIDDYGKKITADFDADFKLIESAFVFMIHGNESQMAPLVNLYTEDAGEPLVMKVFATPSCFDLKDLTGCMKRSGYINSKPSWLEFPPHEFDSKYASLDPKHLKLSSIEKKNDTYFTPSDLVLSNSEAAQIREQINKVGINQYKNFKICLQGIDKLTVEQWVLDADAALSRWNKINVPEPQLIQTYSLPLKQKALIWDLKIDRLNDRRNDDLKIADRNAQESFSFRKMLTILIRSLPSRGKYISREAFRKMLTMLIEHLPNDDGKFEQFYKMVGEK